LNARMNRRERRATRKSQTASGGVRATEPSALCEAGRRFLESGQPLEAQLSCRQALAIDANYADALHLMGLISLKAHQLDHALEWFANAIRQAPKVEYLTSLGTTLQQQRRFSEALSVFDKAVQLKPDDAELWRNIGDVLVQIERFDQALLSYQHVLKLAHDNQDALYKTGALLNQFGRHQEAIVLLDRSVQLVPGHAPTLRSRAQTLFNLKRFEESVADGEKACELAPDADICNNIGAALRMLGRDAEALEWFDKALEIRPTSERALDNKVISLFHLHRFDELFALHEQIKSLGRDTTMTEWNAGLANLLVGNFEPGWRGHEARLKLPSSLYPNFRQPRWSGAEEIEGKTILVCADEGLGDTIHFVRYVPMLADRGARVVLAVQPPLEHLVSGLSGVSQSIPMSAIPSQSFDLHSPVSSLPLAFATRLDTIPSKVPYLPLPSPSRIRAWADRLPPRAGLRVGLVWSGSPAHKNDLNRSIPLRILAPILDAGATFVSLQKDPRPDDKALLEQSGIVDMTADLANFAETAALASCLDLIITVDTSVAHLAGALGLPTWILLPWTPDYRWLLERTDSPWYPTARLFRQTAARDYGSVIDTVRSTLLALATTKQPTRRD
jgi:tetratricopeptide (TPR) repeat protein